MASNGLLDCGLIYSQKRCALFSLANGAAFACNPAIEILRQRLQLYGIPHQSYSGRSLEMGQRSMLQTTVCLPSTSKSWDGGLHSLFSYTSKLLPHHFTVSTFAFKLAVLQPLTHTIPLLASSLARLYHTSSPIPPTPFLFGHRHIFLAVRATFTS